MFTKKNIFVIVFVIIIIGGSVVFSEFYKFLQHQPKHTVKSVKIEDIIENNNEVSIATIEEKIIAEETEKAIADSSFSKTKPIPSELNIEVDFYPQAPFANWDYPWQEACEEASILLAANAYYKHQWTREEFNEEILKLVDWQNKVFNDYWHTTMAQTQQMLKESLALDSVLHYNPTFTDIKAILAQGHLIIFPFNGPMVKNPYYSGDGPTYHVILVKGYTADNQLITHDVGTKRGADYVYPWDMLNNALHDYAIPMTDGERVIIEVLPPQQTKK